MKKTIIVAIIIIIIGIGGYFFMQGGWSSDISLNQDSDSQITDSMMNGNDDEKTDENMMEAKDLSKTIIGKSTEGRDITAYHYYSPSETKENINTELLFVGGIHGGYSWNTALVAYETMDYLTKNSDSIPENIKVTVIPSLNPDGQNKVVGTADRFTKSDVPTSIDDRIPGRFNANDVDLNRNFDCDWQTDAVWQNKVVSGGSAPFSEPESLAIKNYIEENNPNAVIVWYSSAGGVFASSCHDGVLSKTEDITSVYAKASGYKEYKSFDFYEVTGDMVNWLAKKKIPAISVLLTTHEDAEWSKNQAGIEALLKYYAK